MTLHALVNRLALVSRTLAEAIGAVLPIFDHQQGART